jgi:hypothetical protein
MQHTHDRVDDILQGMHAPRSPTGDVRSDAVDAVDAVDVGSMHFDHSDSGFMALMHRINDYEIRTATAHAHAEDAGDGARFAELCSELEAQFVTDSKQEQAENAFITARLAMVAHSVRQ